MIQVVPGIQPALRILPSPRLSKVITSCIMALICAINLYFVVSYLPSLPHPAFFGLVALLAVGYLGLTAYLVRRQPRDKGGGEKGREAGLPQSSGSSPIRGPFPGLDLLPRPRSHLSDSQLPPALPIRAPQRGAGRQGELWVSSTLDPASKAARYSKATWLTGLQVSCLEEGFASE